RSIPEGGRPSWFGSCGTGANSGRRAPRMPATTEAVDAGIVERSSLEVESRGFHIGGTGEFRNQACPADARCRDVGQGAAADLWPASWARTGELEEVIR